MTDSNTYNNNNDDDDISINNNIHIFHILLTNIHSKEVIHVTFIICILILCSTIFVFH